MSITIELPTDVEFALANEASRRGVSLQEYAAEILTENQPELAKPKTGAELVACLEREGLIGTRPDITDSQAFAREIRRQAETRRWE